MQQVLFRIPVPFTDHVLSIYGYGLAMCLGFLAGIWLATRRARREGQPAEIVHNTALAAFIGGVLGARAFFIIQYRDQFTSILDLLRIWEGGLTFYGGLVVAVAAVIVYLRLAGRPVLYWLDILAPCVMLGLAFGRAGCFLNGCCFGDVCTHGWGIAWPVGSIPWYHFAEEHLGALGQALGTGGPYTAAMAGALASTWHPPAIQASQLYSLVNALLLALVLYMMWAWKRKHGQVILSLAVLYGISRFLLEALRADETEAYLLGLPTLLRTAGLASAAAALPALTISQNVAVLMVVGGVVGLIVLARSRRPDLNADSVPGVVTIRPLTVRKRRRKGR